MNQWDKASLTPTFLEQLAATSGVTEYAVDGDSRANGILLCTKVVSSLQSPVHESMNDNFSSEQLYHACSEQTQCLQQVTQTAEDHSSSDVILRLNQNAMVHSFYSYRRSLESFSGYIFPETAASAENANNDDTPDASSPTTTSFVRESASNEQVCSAPTDLNKQPPTTAFRGTESSTVRPICSCSSDNCHISTFSLGSSHSFLNTHDSFNSGKNLSSSSSEPLLSDTAKMKGRLTKVKEPVKKTQEASSFQDISSDCDNYVQSFNHGEVVEDDDEYVN